MKILKAGFRLFPGRMEFLTLASASFRGHLWRMSFVFEDRENLAPRKLPELNPSSKFVSDFTKGSSDLSSD
jgi:hypothetical protein